MKSILPALVLSLIIPLALFGVQSRAPSSPKIVEIVLEAKEGFDTTTYKPYGTVFKISLNRDGMASYYGKTNVKLIGNHQGTISGDEFEKLAKFVTAKDYSRIPDDPVQASPTTPEADAFKPRTITTIAYEGGGLKRISRLTELSPTERAKVPEALFEIEKAIFDTGNRIKWREVE